MSTVGARFNRWQAWAERIPLLRHAVRREGGGAPARPAGDAATRVFVPLTVLLMAAGGLAGASTWALIRDGEERHQIERRDLLRGAIEEYRTVYTDFTLRRANELGAMSWLRPDASPLEIGVRLAPTGLNRFHYQFAYLIGGDGALMASFPPGETAVPPAVARLVAEFRTGETERRRTIQAAPEQWSSEILPVVSDYTAAGDRPAITAVAGVRTAHVPGAVATAQPVLVTVAMIDLRMLGGLDQTAGLHRLKIESSAVDGNDLTMSLIDRHGRIVGWFSWEDDRAVTHAILRMSPIMVAIALGLLGLAALGVSRLRRTARELADSERRAQAQAHEDVLTGLPNRRRMLDVIDQALAERQREEWVAFAFLDLDGFKEVNDALGHHGGDQLLAAVAGRLRTTLRGGGVVGRFGSDEFAFVMTTRDPQAALRAADAVVKSVARPFWMSGQMVQIGVSGGVAQAPRHGVARDELMRRADLALRSAKKHGRNRVVSFEPAMEEEFHNRRFIKRELKRALAASELRVHYQPIVAAESGRIVGVEALLRWEHPVRGTIPPAVFVPIAEQSGLMEPLGEFVLRRALADATRWPGLYVSVNLSPVQVRDRRLVDVVAAALAETGVASSRVVLEITEGVLIEKPDEAAKRLAELRALGVKIALDDFGVGYSSLSYLQRFPIDKLKIDKCFVDPLGRSGNGAVMLQAIVALGRALGLTVLVEGVETEDQRVLLRLAGCDEMQGYLFARPAPCDTVDLLLAEERAADGRSRPAPSAAQALRP